MEKTTLRTIGLYTIYLAIGVFGQFVPNAENVENSLSGDGLEYIGNLGNLGKLGKLGNLGSSIGDIIFIPNGGECRERHYGYVFFLSRMQRM